MCDGVPMDIITCPHCGAHNQAVRDGHNRSGSRRDRCRACRHAFTPTPKEQGHGAATHEQAVRLYLEGMSLRGIGRILGVVHQSVANWVAEAAAHLPADVSDARPTETVEVDELYTFVERKKGRHSS
jgi:transposase-like protein